MGLAFLAFLIGIVAGLRAFMAPAAVSWAAHGGALDPQARWAFMGYRFTPWIFSLLAAVELVTDQLPSTPSRKVPPQFAARLLPMVDPDRPPSSSRAANCGGTLRLGVLGSWSVTSSTAASRLKIQGV